MAKILVHLTLLLVGTNACTPHIIDSVWGQDKEACLALGRPRGDLSLICPCILTLSKVAINTVHIWMSDKDAPVPVLLLDSFKRLPPMLQKLLLLAH